MYGLCSVLKFCESDNCGGIIIECYVGRCIFKDVDLYKKKWSINFLESIWINVFYLWVFGCIEKLIIEDINGFKLCKKMYSFV